MGSRGDGGGEGTERLAWSLLAVVVVIAFSPGLALAQTITTSSRSTPFAGVERQWGDVRLTNGQSTAYDAAFVSLCTNYVHVEATAPATSPRTTGSWASSQNVQLAVNGDFYRYEGGAWFVYGDAVGGGRRWPSVNTGSAHSGWWQGKHGWIAFGPDWVEFSHTEYVKNNAARFGATLGYRPTTVVESVPRGTRSLVSGFPELVIEGRPYRCPDPRGACFPDRGDMRERHPRTAMGLTEDRRTFILLTVDGRNGRTNGPLGVELAEIMHQLGAWVAFNLDGGGSSSMWQQGAGYVNHLSDGSARSVMNHWGVRAGSGGGGSRSPGHCYVAGGCYATGVAGAETELFKDLPPGALGYEEAAILFRAGVTNGCRQSPERYFCPNCQVTRRQFVVLLINAAGIPHPAVSSSSFSDVSDDDWALPYIEAAAREGITNGCGGDRFCPDDPVTRAQAAAFIRRATDWTAVRPSAPTYTDVPADHTFYAPIETLTAKCVTNGCGRGRYCPDRVMTRAETAVFLARAFNMEGINACLEEACNDRDDDFDGTVDESLERPCGSGVGACTRGTSTCAGGSWGACAGAVEPSEEICDGSLDEDCDGTVDEGCSCSGSATRPCGVPEGACEEGTQSCEEGTWGTCSGGVAPRGEVCNEQDDDCDGVVDEGCGSPDAGAPGDGGVRPSFDAEVTDAAAGSEGDVKKLSGCHCSPTRTPPSGAVLLALLWIACRRRR